MSSPERLYINSTNIESPDDNIRKHLSRYLFAAMFADGDILDCACGSGYGSKILALNGHVTAVDISADAIEYAKENNDDEHIDWVVSDATTYKPNKMFDSIVCVETFEHLSHSDGFQLLMNFTEMLKDGGKIILTTPMLRYKDGLPFITNPHHINEMNRDALMKMFKYVFENFETRYFHQNVNIFDILTDETTGFLVVVAKKVSTHGD